MTDYPAWVCADCGKIHGRRPEGDRYGAVRVTKIKAAYDELRAACREEGTPRIQDALDRYEPWADFAYLRRGGE